jgi:ubiquitin C-terminal hydrolase
MGDNNLSQKIKRFLMNIQNPEYIAQQIGTISDLSLATTGQGLTGIDNLGNTCYMNSILQCLRHTAILNSHLFTEQTQRTLMKNFGERPETGACALILVNYIKIIHIMWSHNKTKLSPISFKVLLGTNFDQFANREQHDAHELLVTLLQSFHESLAKNVKYHITGSIITDIDAHIKKAHDDWITYYKNKHSIILDLFSGQLRTELMCLNCQKLSFTFDPVMVIDLPVTSDGNIYQCLDQFVANEQLSEDNLYQCDHCHTKTRAYKKQTLWSLPNVLIIKFNRFQYREMNGAYVSEKINGCVTYPITDLDVGNYISSPLIGQTVYDLYAVSCHLGSLNAGHYYAICYNDVINSWIRYNDEQMMILTDPENVVSNDAYILFYKKKTGQ